MYHDGEEGEKEGEEEEEKDQGGGKEGWIVLPEMKKHGKPKWAAKRNEGSYASSISSAQAAECIAPTTTASVTLSHEDFEHLLMIAHGDASLPSVALANSGILHTPPSSQGSYSLLMIIAE